MTRVSHTLYTSTECDILRSIYSGVNKNTEYGASRVPNFSDRVEKEDDRRYPEEIQNWSIAGNEGEREKGTETAFKHPSKAPVVSICIIPASGYD